MLVEEDKQALILCPDKMKGGELMGFVKVPEMLTPEIIKALAGNAYTCKNEPSPKEEMAAALREYFKADKKWSKKEDKKSEPKEFWNDEECCCPKKVKFIFALNNAAIINVNAACEEDNAPA